MAKYLLLYSTTDGHTLAICERLQEIIAAHAHQVTLLPVDGHAGVDLNGFDSIIIGASIRYGKHSKAVFDFINSHAALLDSKANAFFSVNIVARKPEKNTPASNPYMRKFLGRISWRPKRLAVFAGKLDYPRYRFFDRLMIRFIMLMTHGPTDPRTMVEFTDWEAVAEFGRAVSS